MESINVIWSDSGSSSALIFVCSRRQAGNEAQVLIVFIVWASGFLVMCRVFLVRVLDESLNKSRNSAGSIGFSCRLTSAQSAN